MCEMLELLRRNRTSDYVGRDESLMDRQSASVWSLDSLKWPKNKWRRIGVTKAIIEESNRRVIVLLAGMPTTVIPKTRLGGEAEASAEKFDCSG